MQIRMIFAALCLAIAGCSKPPPAVVTVGDYCTVARAPVLHDGCGAGEVPTLGPNGFASCSALTFSDATTLATEIKKYTERCPD